MKTEMIRRGYNFYGHVQGVGFRYRAKHAANMLGLTGWVRNEYDGSVSMEVQGREELIDRMLMLLGQDRYIDIRDVCVRKLELVEERIFQIKD